MTDQAEWDGIQSAVGTAIFDIGEILALMAVNYLKDEEYQKKLLVDVKARYDAGRAQHAESDSTWAKWTKQDFAENMAEEILDAIIYGAAYMDRFAEKQTDDES